MAKAELFSIPLLGRLIRAVNARPVRREGADARALREALRILESGHALLVFPEGAGGPEGPACGEGTGRACPRGRVLPRPVKVRVSFGAPLSFGKVEGAHRKERYLEASREMMAAIARPKQVAARGMSATELGDR